MTQTYNCDCLPAMKEYPNGYFDLAVVDPPYGIGALDMNYAKSGETIPGRAGVAKRRDYRLIAKQANWDIKPTQEYFDELRRISKRQVIWGGNYFADMLPPSKSFIVWDKRCDDSMTNDFADCELAWCSNGMGVARVFRYLWNGMLQGNMKNKDDRFHPTQKPVALYSWIYRRYAKEGDKILDTHMGSQSSRIAAYDLNLDYVGYEIDEEYYRQGEERFERHTAQMSLFVREDEWTEQTMLK